MSSFRTGTGKQADGSRVIEGGGMRWLVREATYSAIDRRSGQCLIFENDMIIRRVRSYPADWRDYSDDALYALSLVF